jgi:hypothetical protein
MAAAGNGKLTLKQLKLGAGGAGGTGGGLAPAAPQFKYWPYVGPENRVPTKGTGHLHWGITAFYSMDEDGGMRDAVTIEVEADNEEQAVSRAMEIITRENYRVSWVREGCTADPVLKGKGDE